MSKETKSFKFKFFVSKAAALVVAIGGAATVTGCTSLFHEKKVPNTLLKNNSFTSKE